MSIRHIIAYLLAALVAIPAFAAGTTTNDTARADGLILLWESPGTDGWGEAAPIERWDYDGPTLGAFSDASPEHVEVGLSFTFPFRSFASLGHDLRLGAAIIGDQVRGTDATIAALIRRNPASFMAQDGGSPAPLPADEQARLDAAQAQGPGFWGKPSSYLGIGGGALGAYLLAQELSGSDGNHGPNITVEGNGNAVSTGGDANATTATAPPPEPVIVTP